MSATAEATVTLSLIDRLTGPIKRISARIASISKSLGVERITGAVGRLGGSIHGLGDGLMSTTGRLASFLALFGAGGAGAITSAYALAKSAADVGAELTEMSGKLGIGVETLQEYRFAAKMSGVEIAAFDKGVEKIGINAVEASKGNKQLAAAFKTLGVRVKGTKGQMRSTEEILDDTMLALSRIKDPLKRNQLAFKLFGKSGVELVKMLGDGADGLRDLREEARRTGNVMSEDAAAAGDELGDRIDALMERVTGLKNLLGVQLIPVFNEAVKGITDWVDANAALIRSTVTEWARSLVGVIKALIDPTSELRQKIDGLVTGFADFVAKVRPVVDFVGGPLHATLGLIAAFILGPMIAAVVSLGAAVINLGAVILATPLGWILAGLVALGAAVYVLYQKWDEFLAYWTGLWDRVKAAFDHGFIQGITTLLKEFNPATHVVRGINAMIEYFTGVDLLRYGSDMIQTFSAGVSAGAQSLGRTIEQALVDAWVAYETWWNGFSARVREAGAAIVQAILDGLKSKWESVVSWLRGAMADLIGWLPESIQDKLGFKVKADVEVGTGDGKAPPAAPSDGTPPPSGKGPAPAPSDGAAAPSRPAATPVERAARVGGAVNDNVRSAGAAVGAIGAGMLKSVPSGAIQAAAVSANDNAPSTGSGDVNTEILTNSGNNVTTTLNATVNITAAPGADAGAIGAAVRRELDTANRRQAAAAQSALSD